MGGFMGAIAGTAHKSLMLQGLRAKASLGVNEML
jgi:hypothetical protein